jgi:phosphate:Na+ symporter
MQQNLITIGMLAGGIGLFMLAVSMITDGLKSAAGHSLRNLLGKWTKSNFRGILTGFSITALVQSSSAVTIATIGFVNAGLINMHKALGIIYGSNVGTTMTAWLVAAIGFKLNLEALAMPIIGIGMFLRLTGRDSRRAYLGTALVGFGLFFIGVGVLKEAFDGLVDVIDLEQFSVEGIASLMMFVAIGFLMTVLTQSSSAAIAIALTAAAGGLLELHAAAAIVIGTNLGTTSTAALAVIGATPNAKRVAAAHILFNLLTGVMALLAMPWLFWLIDHIAVFFDMQDAPAAILALFHTLFNIAGVLLILPFSSSLARFLDRRFVTQEEIESYPKYLDKTVAVSPFLALNALALELNRIAKITRRMCLEAMSAESEKGSQITVDHQVVTNLANSVADFITHLEKDNLSTEVAEQLATVLRVEQHLLACADQARELVEEQQDLAYINDIELLKTLSKYRAEVVDLIEMSNPELDDFSFADCEEQMLNVENLYGETKGILLQAGAELRLPVQDVIDTIEQNGRIRRMPRQMLRAMRYLSELSMVAEVRDPDSVEQVADEKDVIDKAAEEV